MTFKIINLNTENYLDNNFILFIHFEVLQLYFESAEDWALARETQKEPRRRT